MLRGRKSHRWTSQQWQMMAGKTDAKGCCLANPAANERRLVNCGNAKFVENPGAATIGTGQTIWQFEQNGCCGMAGV